MCTAVHFSARHRRCGVGHYQPDLTRIVCVQRCFGTVRYGVGIQFAGYVNNLLGKDTLPGIVPERAMLTLTTLSGFRSQDERSRGRR